MCRVPPAGTTSTCHWNKRKPVSFPTFGVPLKDVEGAKKDAEKKVDLTVTNKLPVLKPSVLKF